MPISWVAANYVRNRWKTWQT